MVTINFAAHGRAGTFLKSKDKCFLTDRLRKRSRVTHRRHRFTTRRLERIICFEVQVVLRQCSANRRLEFCWQLAFGRGKFVFDMLNSRDDMRGQRKQLPLLEPANRGVTS